MKQFEASVTTVMKFLEAESFSTSVISEHRLCYKKLYTFPEASGKCYTSEIAYQCIEDNRASWSHWHYTGYRHCIDQLEVLGVGSMSYQSNIELELVSRILGHASTQTTRIYAKPSLEMLKTAMNHSNPELDTEEPLWPDDEDEFARICGLR